MSHDKARAAARKRMAETGEPYTAARRAVQAAQQANQQAAQRAPAADGSHPVRMSAEIHHWLSGLCDDVPAAARAVARALAALLSEGDRLGEPLVTSTADAWPWALIEALDRSYREQTERLSVVWRGESDATALSRELREQATELQSVQARLREQHRRLLAEGRTREAAQASDALAAADREAAKVRDLQPRVADARERLNERGRRLQDRANAFRARKEVLKATYNATQSGLLAEQLMDSIDSIAEGAAGGNAGAGAGDGAQARLVRDAVTQLEREIGQEAWPDGLMELRPGDPAGDSVRILFAFEPAGTVLLLAVLDGAEAVAGQRLTAILAAADRLRQVRAGQAPEAAEYGCADSRSFLREFYPPGVGGSDASPPEGRSTPRER